MHIGVLPAYMAVYHLKLGACRDQKWALDLLEVEIQMVIRWKWDLGPLEEQSVLFVEK